MAKKKNVGEILPGTVEEARQAYFDREKAAYEERTGETVTYELDTPLTSTPLAVNSEQGTVNSEEAAADAGGDGEN